MIILRQKEFGNPINKRKRKEWEAKEGSRIRKQGVSGFRVADASKLAEHEIKLSKNGAVNGLTMIGNRSHGEPILAGDLIPPNAGPNWKGDNNLENISVSKDEINRRKYRNRNKNYNSYNPKYRITNVDQAINRRAEEFERVSNNMKIATGSVDKSLLQNRMKKVNSVIYSHPEYLKGLIKKRIK